MLLICHSNIFEEKILFKLYYEGYLNFEIKINEKYSSQKRNKSFEIHWPMAIECKSNYLDILEEKNKNAAT